MPSSDDPLWYVNRCALDSTLVDRVIGLLDTGARPTVRTIVELSVLAESYVLHDGLVLVSPEGAALSSATIRDHWPGGSIHALCSRGGIPDDDAERYTATVLKSAGISFDEFHPDLESLQQAWEEEEEEREERLLALESDVDDEEPEEDPEGDDGDAAEEDDDGDDDDYFDPAALDETSTPHFARDFELDEYDLRVRQADREALAASYDDEYWNGFSDYFLFDEEEEIQKRARRSGIPRLDEAATKMGLSIVQSPLDALESLTTRVQRPVTVDLYRKLADFYRVSVEQLLRFQGIRQAYIPPVLAIVLDRCGRGGRERIPQILGDLREELADFRARCTALQRQLLNESTLARQFEVCQELDAVQAAFIKSVGKGHGRLVYQAWDVVKKGSVLGIVAGGIDKLIERQDIAQIRHRWQAFFDLWRAATLVTSHQKLIQKVFGSEVPDAARLIEIAARTSSLESAVHRRAIQ